MKKLMLTAALLLGGALQASTVKITVQQPKATKSWFMPTNINGFTTNTVGNTIDHLKCDTTVKDSHFQLICRQKGMIVLVYQDNTPQKDAILATPRAIVTIITVREEK